MMELLVSSAGPDRDGCVVRITPESAGWRYVGFEVYRLRKGAQVETVTQDRELCLVVLSGHTLISGAGLRPIDLGERGSVFDGLPCAAYFPPTSSVRVEATSSVCEIALCWAPGAGESKPAVIRPGDCTVEVRGTGNTQREVRNILMEDRPAGSLLVTEVVTPAGHWSSFPPHKHDTDDLPCEAYLEETYYHRAEDPRTFALQTVYTADREISEAIQVRDGDVVLVPRGYHPVAASPVSALYYLNVMAGPERKWKVSFDPSYG